MSGRLLEDLLWFLERPSVTGDEKRLCDDLEARVSRAPGWEARRISNNLVVRRAGPDGSRDRIVFAGHLDTVPEPGGGLPVRVEGGRVYGRGASDMKAGDAVMLALLEDLPWEDSWAEPLFVFYEREEGPYTENGLEAVFSEVPEVLGAELALVLEPTAGALEVGCVGTAQIEVTFGGRSAHSARPWQGENAITAAGAFLATLHERQVEAVVVEGLTFYEVLVPTMVRGGRAKNVVPDTFWINVNYRFAPGKDQGDVRRVFEEYPWVLEAELAFLLEPTANALEIGCIGTAQVEVIFEGRPAHSARPWQGESALTAAGGFLAELHERQVEEVVVEGLTFYEVLVPTMARGGRAKNVVPDAFWINVNYRFAPGKDEGDVRRLFGGLLEGRANYEVADYAPSGPVELDNPLLQRLIETGLEVRPKQAWTDVARFAERGVAAVNFGPGLPSQAHQEAEFAELSLLERCYERLGAFFRHN